MLSRYFSVLRLCSFLLFCALLLQPAHSQQNNSESRDGTPLEGTVVASSRATFVIRSDDNHFFVFTFDRNTNRPRLLALGTRVRVTSDQGDQPGARHATDVKVLEEAQSGPGQGAITPNASAREAAPVPPEVRSVEHDIQRDARRWRVGARAGVGLDPELILFGLQSQMGPIFSRNVFFRPNADFEWGEITDMVALNLEAVYRFPTTTRSGLWAPYVGAGPALNFIHQSFQTSAGQSRNISFSNFDYETGFNILVGFQNRHGTFFEAKTSLYSSPAPVFRLILGKNF